MSYQTDHEYTVTSGSDLIADGGDAIGANALKLEDRVKWLDSGQAIVNPIANTNTSVRVDFSFAFPTPPHVVATPNTGVIETTVKNWSVQSIDTTGFTLWVHRTNATSTAVEWIAHG